MKQQTAVEWLKNKVESLEKQSENEWQQGYQNALSEVRFLLEQAKQMEKEQTFTEQNIEDAYNAGYADAQTNHISDAKNYIHELRYIRNEPNID